MLMRFLAFYIFLSLSLSCNFIYADDVGTLISQGEALSEKNAIEASKLIESLNKGAPLKQKKVKNVQLPHEGKGKCKGQAPSSSRGKCGSTFLQPLEQKQFSDSPAAPQLFVFVSQSMPKNSLKDLWHQAQKVGGKLIFRGLLGDSFKKTQKYIQDLEIVADIDPTKFEEFEVIYVPTFILVQNSKEKNLYDKMAGNVSLNEFLEQSMERGDLEEEARTIHHKIQGGTP